MAPTFRARNEQRKLRAAFINALAITLFVTALAGPAINPTLADTLSVLQRALMGVASFGVHLFASWVLRGIEDR